MSPRKAPATCCATLGWLAFQPKRPTTVSWRALSHTRFSLPEMPSPSASSGSAMSSSVASGTASSSPSPTMAGATRGDSSVSGRMAPYRRSLNV